MWNRKRKAVAYEAICDLTEELYGVPVTNVRYRLTDDEYRDEYVHEDSRGLMPIFFISQITNIFFRLDYLYFALWYYLINYNAYFLTDAVKSDYLKRNNVRTLILKIKKIFENMEDGPLREFVFKAFDGFSDPDILQEIFDR